jgi:ornithine cyclodeaminase
MRTFDAEQLSKLLPWPELIDAIGAILHEDEAESPERHVHTVSGAGVDEDILLLKPAWVPGELVGIKAVTFFGSNAARGLPTINAAYLLFDGSTGAPVAVMDGEELGSRRTMAASALAARYLARADARRLLVVGTGQLAPHAVAAHCTVRDYDMVEVWGRDGAKAQAVVDAVSADGWPATRCDDLDGSVAEADVISCVTSASQPLIKGDLLRPGTHLDLVGSFKADMRESDDACARRADLIVLDTYAGAVLAGDISQPRDSGIITDAQLTADLKALTTGDHPGRPEDLAITMYKSAGFALEDLAAARLAFSRSV